MELKFHLNFFRVKILAFFTFVEKFANEYFVHIYSTSKLESHLKKLDSNLSNLSFNPNILRFN